MGKFRDREGVSDVAVELRRRVSLVDWVSFELMRRLRLEAAFAFDRNFAGQGFATVP
jgi:predicted nucleic acid-binding protein